MSVEGMVSTTWAEASPLDFVGVLKKMAEVMIEYFKEFNLPQEYWMGVYSRLHARAGGERFFDARRVFEEVMEEFIEAGKVERFVGEEVLESLKFFESYLFELEADYTVVLSHLGLEVLSTLSLERSENSD